MVERKPKESKIGTRADFALKHLVLLYCSETNSGKPYFVDDPGKLENPAPIRFAREVLLAWGLIGPDDVAELTLFFRYAKLI